MIRINLLPVKANRKRETGLQQLVLMAVALVLTLGVVLAYYVSLDNKITALREDIQKDEAEIARLEKIIGEVNQYEEQKKKLMQQLTVIEELEKGKAGPVKVLDAVASAIPKRVWINDFVETNGSATITGYGLEMADVSEFLKALEKSPHFKEVRLGFTENSPQKGINTFSFSVTMKITYNI
jgi:type IV pilus assembly protein PilN